MDTRRTTASISTGTQIESARLLSILLVAWISITNPFVSPLQAHDLEFTYTVIVIREDNSYQVDVTADLDAIALGLSQGIKAQQVVKIMRQLSPKELEERITKLRRTFHENVEVFFDETQANSASLSFPEYGLPISDDVETQTILGLTARFTGDIPIGTKTITIKIARSFPPVYLTIIDLRNGRDHQQVLARGETSEPYALSVEQIGTSSNNLTTFKQFLYLGIWHIIPEGIDHVLFVLGLFLLNARPKFLLWQITAFTIAHTFTLAISSYGLITFPPTIVEPLIALSISYVAIENLFTRDLKFWRPLIVFGFGLLHGMGFAGVLGEIGSPDHNFLITLLSFNLGVEIGQFGVILLAFLTLGWFQNRTWYRPLVTIPMSLLIAVMGLYWFVERIPLVRIFGQP